MKKTFLFLLTVMLAFGMTLVSCGGDDDEGPTTYTVTFKNGDATLYSVKILDKQTLGDKWPTRAQLGGEIVSDTEYKVNRGWFDEDGKRFVSDVPVTKNLTLQPSWYEIPATDALAVGEGANAAISEAAPLAFDLTVEHINTTPAERKGAEKYFRLTGDTIPPNHVIQINAEFKVTKSDGTTEIFPRFVGFQGSIENYKWNLDWISGDNVSGSPYTVKLQNNPGVYGEKDPDAGKPLPALPDKALRFLIDELQDDTVALGDTIKVIITSLEIVDIGEPLTVTFTANGGTGADVVKDVFVGDKVPYESIPYAPFANTDKKLAGWTINDTDLVDPAQTAVTGNIIFKAVWKNYESSTSISQYSAAGTATTWPDDGVVIVTLKAPTANKKARGHGVGAFQENIEGSWPSIIPINVSAEQVDDGTNASFSIRVPVTTIKALHDDNLQLNIGAWEGYSLDTAKLYTYSDTLPPVAEFTLVDNPGGKNYQTLYEGAVNGAQVAAGDTWKFTYTFTADKALKNIAVQFVDNTEVAGSWWTTLSAATGLTDDLNQPVPAGTTITGSVDIDITTSATSEASAANKLAVFSNYLTDDEATHTDTPTLTFTEFSFEKKVE